MNRANDGARSSAFMRGRDAATAGQPAPADPEEFLGWKEGRSLIAEARRVGLLATPTPHPDLEELFAPILGPK